MMTTKSLWRKKNIKLIRVVATKSVRMSLKNQASPNTPNSLTKQQMIQLLIVIVMVVLAKKSQNLRSCKLRKGLMNSDLNASNRQLLATRMPR